MTSVIIPVYNGAETARRTVSAVLAMHGVDEWIWVDDGSTDDTSRVLASETAGADRGRVLRLPENRGRAGARNAGIEASRGTVIVFLDVDVEPQPHTAQALAEAAVLPAAVAAVGRLAPVLDTPEDPYQDYLAHFARGLGPSVQAGDALDWRYFLTTVCAVRREALRAVDGFREEIGYGEDVDLACRLGRDAPSGLRLAGTTVQHYDVGTLSDALDRADAFGRSLHQLQPDCRRQSVGWRAEVPGLRAVAQVASPVLHRLVRSLPAGSARHQAVRYLLATRILSASRRA